MTLKTLLLGSAAAFAVVGGAQAADLSVAEPVDYVRICDAFGTGYWYIPGTDTCLKISGNVEFDLNLHDNSNVWSGGTHSSYWDFVTSAGLAFNAKSMTEYGVLEANIPFTMAWNNNSASSANVALDKGTYIKVGPLELGYDELVFDNGGGFADSVYREDIGVKQISLHWTLGSFGLALGIEDPRDRWGTNLLANYNVPDLTAQVTYSQAGWSAALAGGYSNDVSGGSRYGVSGNVTINLPMIAAGDQIRVGGAYGGSSFVGSAFNASNSNYSAYATLVHYLTSSLHTDWSFGYLSATAGTSWQVGGDLVWVPTTGLTTRLKGQYVVTNGGTGVWSAQARAVRSF